MTHPVIELHRVTRTYGSPPTVALDGVDLQIHEGELLAIVGPSGSGKSTMLNIIGTLDRATSGQITIAGTNVADLNDAQLSALRAYTIGFVFQQFHLTDGVTAVENVSMGLLYTGMPHRQRLARAQAALTRVGLGHRMHHHPNKMSGGERQRVAIARALIANPKILLADEPTGSLDSKSGADVMELLHDLHQSGTTVVVITHDQDLADRMPRQVRIFDGKIISDQSGSALASTVTL